MDPGCQLAARSRQRYVDEHGLDRMVTKLMNGALVHDGLGGKNGPLEQGGFLGCYMLWTLLSQTGQTFKVLGGINVFW